VEDGEVEMPNEENHFTAARKIEPDFESWGRCNPGESEIDRSLGEGLFWP